MSIAIFETFEKKKKKGKNLYLITSVSRATEFPKQMEPLLLKIFKTPLTQFFQLRELGMF